MDRDKYIMNRLMEHYIELESRGYEVVALMLQGSQNYGLDVYNDEYFSDIDSKAIVLPRFKDFCRGKEPISKTIILPNNEHIDVKDIRVMIDMFFKENISYIELLYTPYKIINPKYSKDIAAVFAARDQIVGSDPGRFINCIVGMSGQKVKALCHPYPNLIDKINKYGYDGKQLSHCVRLYEFLDKYLLGTPVGDCYWSTIPDLLIAFKKQQWPDGTILSKQKAVKLCNHFYESTKELAATAVKEGKPRDDVRQTCDAAVAKILGKWFMEEIVNEGLLD